MISKHFLHRFRDKSVRLIDWETQQTATPSTVRYKTNDNKMGILMCLVTNSINLDVNPFSKVDFYRTHSAA